MTAVVAVPTAEPAVDALNTLRINVEDLDARLIATIAERVALTREIGRVKHALNQSVIDPVREARVVMRATALARAAGLPEDEIRALYWRLMAMARRAQVVDRDEQTANHDNG